jgi:hypothetical protein
MDRNREFFRSQQGISGKDQGSAEGGADKGASLQGTESRRPSAAACCGDRRLSGEEKLIEWLTSNTLTFSVTDQSSVVV